MTPFERELLGCTKALMGFAVKLTRCEVRAEDLVQATLLRALEKQHMFQPDTNMKGWLFTIMYNMHVQNYRKDKRMVEDPEGLAVSQFSVQAAQEHREELRDVLDVFNTLNPDQQTALAMVGVLGHRYDETADYMGIAVGTVKSMVHRAKATLEKRYETATRRPSPA
ncbi:sigma-70 family RNA polymerase sigma factor [Mesorhizobium sp. WSM2239]|uniref:Sigma-70 family RNA polymerase sigma factor n=2 Tax=unclassified Mesorhizobium TaxID=325217 RepID=A0AAU8D1J8_9HYPH